MGVGSLPFTCCVTLGRFLTLSGFGFSQLWNGDSNSPWGGYLGGFDLKVCSSQQVKDFIGPHTDVAHKQVHSLPHSSIHSGNPCEQAQASAWDSPVPSFVLAFRFSHLPYLGHSFLAPVKQNCQTVGVERMRRGNMRMLLQDRWEGPSHFFSLMLVCACFFSYGHPGSQHPWVNSVPSWRLQPSPGPGDPHHHHSDTLDPVSTIWGCWIRGGVLLGRHYYAH